MGSHTRCIEDEHLEIRWKLIVSVQTLAEVDSSKATVGMNLNPCGFHIAGSISPSGEVTQVDLDLIPTIIQAQWHSAVERPDSSTWLEVAGAEPPSEVFVIQDLHLKGEVALQVLDHKDKERESDSKTGVGAHWAVDVGGAHVVPDDFKRDGTDARVSDTFDVAIHHLGTPNAQRFVTDCIEDREKSGLVSISKHFLQSQLNPKSETQNRRFDCSGICMIKL